ncbi:MAG TPA: ABC transporter permease, partial [Microlunatus sp.]|nr:ABC transporter permease [Microlunatus sp.]
RRRRLSVKKTISGSRLLGPAVVVGVWALASASGHLDPRTLPAPWTVAQTGWDLWTDGSLRQDTLTSLARAGKGLLLGLTIGTVLALLAGLSRAGDALIDGTVQINRSIPTLGLIPLFIVWLGIGEGFKVAIIAIIVYIPVYLNLHAGLRGIDLRFVELAEVSGLNRWQFIRHVVLPGALPGFFVGLRMAVTYSWLGLVVLEQINAINGLGYMMFQATNYGQTAVIVVGLAVYGMFGFISDLLVRLVERRALSWRQTISN